MNHKGFGKIASPQKSLNQELRQVFRKFNKRGKLRSTPWALHEVSRLESRDGKVHQVVVASNQNDMAQGDACSGRSHHHDSEIQALGNYQGFKEPSAPYTLPAREDFEASHWQEWGESGIDSEIAALNFKSLSGNAAFDYLLYSDKISRRNDGRLRDRDMRRYAHLSNGGWWCSGINIITGEDSDWGCFKPNTPRIDEGNSKAIKYEHPPKVDTEIFALRIPARIWELIGRRYDVALPENYQSLPYGNFWRWVRENTQIPVIICEGAKKAAAILSCGYVAIGIPGVWGGRRQPKDEYGENSGAPYLIPQLAAYAQPGRRIYFCFDADVKRTTVRSVNGAIAKTAKLLSLRGCEVRVMGWHLALGKGIDDVLAAYGRDQFDTIYCDALKLDEWNTKQLRRLTYTPDLNLNQRYLGELAIPLGKQLIGLKSPKNTGKTHLLQWLTDPIIRAGERRVLVITHRVQLATQLVKKLGLPFITEVKQTEQGSHFGMGLVIDSLHPKSQAKFNPDEWKGCWLILDEIMQLIWHLLSSSTCQTDRVAIIKNFKRLLQNVVNYGRKIFIADADLNDIGIDFIKGLLGQEIDTFLVENTFQFVEPWQVNLVQGNNPAQLVKILTQKLENGDKCFVALSGQRASSKWGSRNLGVGREFLPDREINVMSTALKNGGGDYFIPDTNKSFIGKKIDALDWIGYKELRETDGLSNNHPLAQAVFEKAKTHQSDLSLILGAKSNMFALLNTPMQVCQKLASLTGYKFPRLRREGTRGNQVWIYGVAAPDFQKDDEGNLVFVDGRAVPVSDRREEVFTAWVERDILAREKAAKAKLEAQVQATIPNCQLSALAETEINTLTTLQEQYAEQKTQTLTEEVESIVITHDSESQVIIAELPVENHQQSTEAVIEKLLKISNWGEVAANQAEIDQVWSLLSENQRSHLWQLHQKYQQQLSLEELAAGIDILELKRLEARGIPTNLALEVMVIIPKVINGTATPEEVVRGLMIMSPSLREQIE